MDSRDTHSTPRHQHKNVFVLVSRARYRLLSALAFALMLFGPMLVVDAYRPEDVLQYAAYPSELTGADVYFNALGIEYPSTLYQARAQLGFNVQLEAFGFCPQDHQGCYDPTDSRLLGCCHRNQTCALNYARFPGAVSQFVGCVDDPLQLCYQQICPPGYGCCRGNFGTRNSQQKYFYAFCVPFAPVPGWTFDPAVYGPYPEDVQAAAADFDAYCGTPELIRPNGILNTMTNRDLLVDYKLYNTNEGQYVDYMCQGSGTGAYCAAGDACGTEEVVWSVNSTTGEATLVDIETFCCPADQTLCLAGQSPPSQWEPGTPANVTQRLPLPPQFVGCAIDARSETCCGSSICGGESKCCAAFLPSTYLDSPSNVSYSYNATLTAFCCPAEAQCCYGVPPSEGAANGNQLWLNEGAYGSEGVIESETLPGARGYCGWTFRGSECGVDIMQPFAWAAQHSIFPAP